MSNLEILFEPFAFGRGDVVSPNRVVMGPMTINQATEDGHLTPWITEWYRRRAAGGVGAIIGAAVFVSQDGRGWANAVGISDDSYVAGWAESVQAAHEHGTLFGTQLFHGGAASPSSVTGQQPVSASDWADKDREPARALTGEEIETLIEKFAEGARRSLEAGCDFVELHGAHGYLLHQFWRKDINRRTDAWGDPVAFPVAVTRAVREVIGDSVPLLYRFSVHADAPDSTENPVTPKDLETFIVSLEAAGVDVWDISCFRDSRRGYFGTEILLPEWVRQFSAKPRMVAGNLVTPEDTSEYLTAGHAEAAVLAKALIMDAEWVNKAREGRSAEIRPLMGDDWNSIFRGIDPGA
jgi:2,4-dienoyl-CoA reductase-like NADH-dependent reductase (Old Yellow Enzyme family)